MSRLKLIRVEQKRKRHIFIGFVICFVMLVIYTIFLVINLLANRGVEEQLEKIESERAFVHETASKLKAYSASLSFGDAQKAVNKAYDVVSASPIASNDEAMQYEIAVIKLVNDLSGAVLQNDVDAIKASCDLIIKNTSMRNAIVKH